MIPLILPLPPAIFLLNMRFSVETARLAAAKSVATRKAKAAERAAQRLLPPPPPAPPPLPTPDNYTSDRLRRVRKQLDRIDRWMMEEEDPAKVDRLASAQMRLSDQEFALAGRPKPGNTRPESSKGRPARAVQVNPIRPARPDDPAEML